LLATLTRHCPDKWQREKRLCNDILPNGQTLDRVYDSSAQKLVDILGNTGESVIKEAAKGMYVPVPCPVRQSWG
jgi:hypothetical protein